MKRKVDMKVRLESDLYDDFKKFVDSQGVTVSDAIRAAVHGIVKGKYNIDKTPRLIPSAGVD